MEAGHKAKPMDLVIEAASLSHTLGRSASSGILNIRMSTRGLQSHILTLGLATITTVATPMASREFGATQRTQRRGGISAITVQMAIRETTAPFHQLAAAHTIAMAMPLWTWIVQMAAYATVPVGGPAMTARSHRRARLTQTAVGMAQLPMLTRPMVAHVLAQTASAAEIAQHHRPARTKHVPATEQQVIRMQLTVACAPVRTISWGTIAPFHQLAAVRNIAMAMPLWTWTAQMAAYASVPMAGPAMTARSHQRATQRLTAVVMAQPVTWTRLTVADVIAQVASVAMIARWPRCAAKP